MDDLAGEEDLAVRELTACLIRIVDGPLHPVAEAEFLCQSDSRIPGLKAEITLAEQIDEASVIISLQLSLNLGLESKALPEVDLGARDLLHVTGDGPRPGGTRKLVELLDT